VGIVSRDKLERPVIAHGLGLAQPDFAEPAPAEKTNQTVAIEEKGGGEMPVHAVA